MNETYERWIESRRGSRAPDDFAEKVMDRLNDSVCLTWYDKKPAQIAITTAAGAAFLAKLLQIASVVL